MGACSCNVVQSWMCVRVVIWCIFWVSIMRTSYSSWRWPACTKASSMHAAVSLSHLYSWDFLLEMVIECASDRAQPQERPARQIPSESLAVACAAKKFNLQQAASVRKSRKFITISSTIKLHDKRREGA